MRPQLRSLLRFFCDVLMHVCNFLLRHVLAGIVLKDFLHSRRLCNHLSSLPTTSSIMFTVDLNSIRTQGLWSGESINQSLRAFWICFASCKMWRMLLVSWLLILLMMELTLEHVSGTGSNMVFPILRIGWLCALCNASPDGISVHRNIWRFTNGYRVGPFTQIACKFSYSTWTFITTFLKLSSFSLNMSTRISHWKE